MRCVTATCERALTVTYRVASIDGALVIRVAMRPFSCRLVGAVYTCMYDAYEVTSITFGRYYGWSRAEVRPTRREARAGPRAVAGP